MRYHCEQQYCAIILFSRFLDECCLAWNFLTIMLGISTVIQYNQLFNKLNQYHMRKQFKKNTLRKHKDSQPQKKESRKYFAISLLGKKEKL